MPLYEYECESCGFRFEVIQRFADPAITACRSCGGPVHKLLSPPAIQFKGSGWYITDYARKGPSEPSAASAGTDGAGGTPSSSSDKAATGSSGSATPPSSSSPSS